MQHIHVHGHGTPCPPRYTVLLATRYSSLHPRYTALYAQDYGAADAIRTQLRAQGVDPENLASEIDTYDLAAYKTGGNERKAPPSAEVAGLAAEWLAARRGCDHETSSPNPDPNPTPTPTPTPNA